MTATAWHKAVNIPAEVHLGFLGRTFDVHWDRHAMLMSLVWLVLVPVAILAVRYFKPAPTPYGIDRGTGRFDRRLVWWTVHWVAMYAAIGLALVATAVALVASGGFSGSVHGFLGLATIALGALQIGSAWLRGPHGGKHGIHSDPAVPATWRGDHYDMTARRRWFEAYHKTMGHATLALALCAAVTGLMQFWLPWLAVPAIGGGALFLLLCVLFERRGMRQDTYRSVYGDHPLHPYNRERAPR